METGVIEKIVADRGFGCIRDDFGAQHFFHATSVLDVLFDALRTGDAVTFAFGTGRDGRTKAVDVQPVS
jgi:cold shock CspA family protein